MKQIIVKQQKNPTGFGKPKPVEYEGVEFSNGKVAFVDENEAVNVYEKRSSALNDLEKHGKAVIEDVKKGRKS